MRNLCKDFILAGLILVGGLCAKTKAQAQTETPTPVQLPVDYPGQTEINIADSVPPRSYTLLEATFQSYLDKAMPNNVILSHAEYLRIRNQVCITDKRDESVTMAFRRTDGSGFSIHYSLVDANHNGLVDGIAVDFDGTDNRKDFVIPYKRFGRLYDIEGSCMSFVTHAVLDLETDKQSCHCKPVLLEPLRARVYPNDKDNRASKQMALQLR